MPKNPQLNHVLVIGSGPIVIGQASEFDYSGTQACRVLKEEGIRVSLINSNPATIMTDPEFADATYIEPITPDFVEKVLLKEANSGHPIDAILATLGGQTALNTAVELAERGILDKYQVELIGADIGAIKRGEDRQLFKDIVHNVGGESARSKVCYSLEEALSTARKLQYPVVVRPSFTMGGLGSGMAYSEEDLIRIAEEGLHSSPAANVLIEESIIGWKEFELELMRDRKDNVVVVCSIENVDAVGVHTGDSITVAPAMTLTDREYQVMRDISINILREVGVATGGCNIQFAVNPVDGRMIVIEMNPRVSRSSALASKATGFPIAKIATKLAIGYALDEITNDITKKTPACFEPTLDYVVVKVPRFAFEKFPSADPTLTTTMKSVGEAMAFGGSFLEALNKALRSLETKIPGFWLVPDQIIMGSEKFAKTDVLAKMQVPTEKQIFYVELALRLGATVSEVAESSQIDPWFIAEIAALVALRTHLTVASEFTEELLREAKNKGISDRQLAVLSKTSASELDIRELREKLAISPVFKTVDTCAAEFAAETPYHYSTYSLDKNSENELLPGSGKLKVIVLGSGPNRIGQGIEFDYSCVHAAMELSAIGYETIMVNCNPETVSTDYDTSDRLFFEPLTFEEVLNIVSAEQKSGNLKGVIVTLGGQTPLSLAKNLERQGVPILGTSPAAIELAEDRAEFEKVLEATDLPAPPFGMASTLTQALDIAKHIGYPVLARPSFVLGGRGMEIVYNAESLKTYIQNATELSSSRPVLIDRFLEDAIEIDVDALCDGREVYLGAIMEHIEEAGIHSGDSACTLPPITIGSVEREKIFAATAKLALNLGVKGLINIQFALKDDVLYVLEANPRASRTVPFVSKATGVSLAKACARIMVGESIASLIANKVLPQQHINKVFDLGYPIAVKEAVLPFHRFRRVDGSGVDTLLGPEMKSTGEVMGISTKFSAAFAKGQIATFGDIPRSGNIFVSVSNKDKRNLIYPIKRLQDLGFKIYATEGTAEIFILNDIDCIKVHKFSDHITGKVANDHDTVVEKILSNEFDLVINTPVGNEGTRNDGYEIRNAAMIASIPCITTARGASALAQAIESAINDDLTVFSLQEFHEKLWS